MKVVATSADTELLSGSSTANWSRWVMTIEKKKIKPTSWHRVGLNLTPTKITRRQISSVNHLSITHFLGYCWLMSSPAPILIGSAWDSWSPWICLESSQTDWPMLLLLLPPGNKHFQSHMTDCTTLHHTENYRSDCWIYSFSFWYWRKATACAYMMESFRFQLCFCKENKQTKKVPHFLLPPGILATGAGSKVGAARVWERLSCLCVSSSSRKGLGCLSFFALLSLHAPMIGSNHKFVLRWIYFFDSDAQYCDSRSLFERGDVTGKHC